MEFTNWNIPEPLRTGDNVRCRMEGEIIEAQVSITSKDIAVKLLDAQWPLTSFRHIPLPVPKSYTKECNGVKCASDKGMTAVRELMEGLCRDLHILRKNSDAVHGRLTQYKEIEKAFCKALKETEAKAATAGLDFKEGRLSQKEYQTAIKELNEYGSNLYRLRKNEFCSLFPELAELSSDTEDLMRIIGKIPV